MYWASTGSLGETEQLQKLSSKDQCPNHMVELVPQRYCCSSLEHRSSIFYHQHWEWWAAKVLDNPLLLWSLELPPRTQCLILCFTGFSAKSSLYHPWNVRLEKWVDAFPREQQGADLGLGNSPNPWRLFRGWRQKKRPISSKATYTPLLWTLTQYTRHLINICKWMK